MDDSANQAAEGTIAGGTIYSYGPQPNFASEIASRAGGLMLARPYSTDVILTARDTVLAAVTGSEDEVGDESLRLLLEEADTVRAQIVLFGDAGSTPQGEFAFVAQPRDPEQFANDPSLASISNIVGMWAWTGRYIAACAKRGMMPCVYQSHILPDGRERTRHIEQNEGGRFHRISSVRPEDTELIAAKYLDEIEHSLREILSRERAALQRAALLLRASRDRGNTVAVYSLGHMFPGEFNQPQQPDWLVHIDSVSPGAAVDTSLVLHYMSFPWEIVEKIDKAGQSCIVTCSQPALAGFITDTDNVYINPHWSIYDAVVELPNYDVRVLPASGVLTAAIYWQLVEWTAAGRE